LARCGFQKKGFAPWFLDCPSEKKIWVDIMKVSKLKGEEFL
jgi:hypothetical protein